ncbi:MAG: hypothetical protein M1830_003001 [Pleopsidium flavum]|nr:MAG: hypothetical protein M1830_003001 [Pleopsidium flavum]
MAFITSPVAPAHGPTIMAIEDSDTVVFTIVPLMWSKTVPTASAPEKSALKFSQQYWLDKLLAELTKKAEGRRRGERRCKRDDKIREYKKREDRKRGNTLVRDKSEIFKTEGNNKVYFSSMKTRAERLLTWSPVHGWSYERLVRGPSYHIMPNRPKHKFGCHEHLKSQIRG